MKISRLLRPFLALLLALGATGAAAWFDPHSFSRALLLVAGGQGEDFFHGQPGWVGDISLHIEYPPYSGRPPLDIEGSDGAIRALAGSRVAIEARTDRQVRKGYLLHSESRLLLSVEGLRLRGEMLLQNEGEWRFELIDTAGKLWREPRGHPIRIEPDFPPQVELLQPFSDRQVRPDDLVTIEYRASDDFGLGESQLVYHIEGRQEGEQRRSLWRAGIPVRRNVKAVQLDLATFRLEPGERLLFFVEVNDNDTVNGPKCGRSATRSLTVFSPEREKMQLLQQAQQAWEELLLHLADNLELDPSLGQPTKVDSFFRLKSTGWQLTETFSRLVLAVAQAVSRAEKLLAAASNILEHLRQLDKAISALLARSGKTSAASLEEHRRLRVTALERDVLFLEGLLDLERLEQIDKLAQRLRAARDRLEELLRAYRQAPSQEIRRQLEEEIMRLKKTIAELAERQREVLKGIQDQYLNPQALARLLQERDIEGALDQLQRLLHEGRLDEALSELQRLGDRLGRLEDQLRLSRSRLAGGRWRELAESMAKLSGELGQITAEQERLLEQTKESREKLLDEYLQRSREKLKQAFARLRKKLLEANEELARLQQSNERFLLNELLDRSRQSARLLEQALQLLDAEAAREQSRRLAQSAQTMAEQTSAFDPRGQSDATRRARRAARLSEEIREEIEQLFPDEEKLLGEGEREKLRGLAHRQRSLERRLAQLRQQMEKLNEQAPLFGPSPLGRLSSAGNEMQGAAQQLEQRRSSRALPHQGRALAELQELGKELQRSCQSGSAEGLPMPVGGFAGAGERDLGGPGGQPQIREVELPAPEDFRASDRLRHELMEGMQDPVPDGYRPQVRAYYEELVK